jgi:methyl-accepting chemotaxis protein
LEALKQQGDAVFNTAACVQTVDLGKLMPVPADLITSQNALFISCQRSFMPVIQGMVAESNTIGALASNDETSLNGGVHGTVLNTYALVLVGLIAVLVGSFFAIGRWVVSPIKSLQGVMGRLSGGDLQAEVTGTDRKDEIGGMARAVEVFKEAGLEKQRLAAQAEAQRSPETGRSASRHPSVARSVR